MLNDISSNVRQLFSVCSIVCSSFVSVQNAVADSADKIYQDNCAFCHSRLILPFTGPELRGHELLPDYTKTLVRKGSKGMITFTKASLSDEQLDVLATWLQHSQAPQTGVKK